MSEEKEFELKEGVKKDGIKYWYKNGKLHGNPAVEFPDGDYLCFEKGNYHCLSGPAVKVDGREFYYLYGIQYSKKGYYMTLAQINLGILVQPNVFCTTVK